MFWLSLTCATALALLLVCFATPIAELLHQPAFAPVLRWSTPILVLDSLSSLQGAQFRRELNFRPLAIRRTCATLLAGIVGVTAAVAGAGVYALIGSRVTAGVAGLILLWGQSRWRPSLVFSFASVKELLPYSSQSFGSSLLMLLNRRSDDLLVGSVLGPVALGFYTVAYRILTVLNNTVTAVIQRVVFPSFARLQAEPERRLKAFQRTTHAASLLGMPVFGGLAVLAPVIIPVLFGPQWRPSIPTMRVLAVVGLLQNILLFNNVVCRAAGKPGYNTFYLGLNALANVLGFALFVRQGIFAVALVLLVNTIALSPVSFVILRRVTNIHLSSYLAQFRAPVAAVCLASLLTLAVGATWPSAIETPLFLLTACAVFASGYLASLFLFDRKFIAEVLHYVFTMLPQRHRRNGLLHSFGSWLSRLQAAS